MRIGVISDTHGVLPASVRAAFEGCERIVHAGDVGSLDVLRELEAIAPVTAVAGNTDPWGIAGLLDHVARLELAGVSIVVAHHLEDAVRLHRASPADVLVFGHTHVPHVEDRDGALLLNPGSAARPRHGARPTVGLLEVAARPARARIVEL